MHFEPDDGRFPPVAVRTERRQPPASRRPSPWPVRRHVSKNGVTSVQQTAARLTDPADGRAASRAGVDGGRALDTMTASSQLIGDITLSTGLALLEATAVDRRTRRTVNANVAEYSLSVSADVPAFEATPCQSMSAPPIPRARKASVNGGSSVARCPAPMRASTAAQGS